MDRRLIWLIAFAASSACAPDHRQAIPPPVIVQEQQASAGPALLARLERTQCFGWCPAYAVEISRDGLVRYEGREYVLTKGNAVRSLRPEQVALLRAAFARAKFLQLPEKCCDCFGWTDAPSAVVTFADGRDPKTIRDYHGCPKTPEDLRSLEDEIDRIVEIEKWIGTPAERQRCCSSVR